MVRDGKYRISVRRWPAESSVAINATLPAGKNVPGADRAFRTTAGKSIAATHATLRIDGKDLATKPVPKDAVEVSFVTDLKQGSHELAPFFRIKEGELGAYYTIVTHLD